MKDCGCVPKRSYVAGTGNIETHAHVLDDCPTCDQFGACEWFARNREITQAWVAQYLQ